LIVYGSLEQGIAMTQTPTVEALLAAWIEAFNRHDLDTHAALYTQDACLFGSIPDLLVGRPAIRGYFSRRGPGVHVRRYPMPHIVPLGSDAVATAAHVDFADGEMLVPYRVTWVLVKVEGNWRIAQHHGSPRSDA
jgi:uncharacterized protein (TIGR02246 family)